MATGLSATIQPQEVTLGTFVCGDESTCTVLEDWLAFLGFTPGCLRVVTVADRPDNFVARCGNRSWPNLDVVELPGNGRPLYELDTIALDALVRGTTTRWLLTVKLDTLPYRIGHADWFANAVAMMQQHRCRGFTGSFRSTDLRPLQDTYALTRKVSQNFALLEPSWQLEAMQHAGLEVASCLENHQPLPYNRFCFEASMEGYLADQDSNMLFIGDSPTFSVFHVNQWGRSLLDIRQRYHQREDIEPYLNTPVPIPPHKIGKHNWEWYYGWPRPSPLQRTRIWLGAKRRQFIGF